MTSRPTNLGTVLPSTRALLAGPLLAAAMSVAGRSVVVAKLIVADLPIFIANEHRFRSPRPSSSRSCTFRAMGGPASPAGSGACRSPEPRPGPSCSTCVCSTALGLPPQRSPGSPRVRLRSSARPRYRVPRRSGDEEHGSRRLSGRPWTALARSPRLGGDGERSVPFDCPRRGDPGGRPRGCTPYQHYHSIITPPQSAHS
jgi:hypothetical protein